MLLGLREPKNGFYINVMIELVRTSNPVKLSWLVAQLKDDNIEPVVLDYNISIVEGSIGAFPCRVMVNDDDYTRARVILVEAEAIERRP
jgi:hypothetical protein